MLFGVPTYSAALTARVELADGDDEMKNAACPALAGPNELRDIALHILARLESAPALAALGGVEEWNRAVRLNPASWALDAVKPDDEVAQQAILRIIENSGAAKENLRRVLHEAPV